MTCDWYACMQASAQASAKLLLDTHVVDSYLSALSQVMKSNVGAHNTDGGADGGEDNQMDIDEGVLESDLELVNASTATTSAARASAATGTSWTKEEVAAFMKSHPLPDGLVVRATYHGGGTWYDGVIQSSTQAAIGPVMPGVYTYNVLFDDGDRDPSVAATNVTWPGLCLCVCVASTLPCWSSRQGAP